MRTDRDHSLKETLRALDLGRVTWCENGATHLETEKQSTRQDQLQKKHIFC